MAISPDYGAFMEKFILSPTPSPELPLHSLSFAVKDMFAVQGRVSSFGNPDWKRTHSAADATAPVITALLKEGATCVGTLIMDEMAYSILGENIHYGTPTNPCAADRVPGGSSSGSAVAAGAKLADFTIGTDCLGSSRIPASYCGTFGIRPSHGVISKIGVIPMAQSLDTVGWFAKDPAIFAKVGRVLLQSPRFIGLRPSKVIIADDCFMLSTIPHEVLIQDAIRAIEKLYGGDVLEYKNLSNYVIANVPSLKDLLTKDVPYVLAGLSKAMQLIERYEFKNNHAEWITIVKPDFGPGIKESIEEALRTTGEQIDTCHSIKWELRSALNELLRDGSVLVIPTVPGPPPKLGTSQSELEDFNAMTFSLQSIAGLSGCSQVTMPLGMYNDLPISLSFVAKYGDDGFLLSLVEIVYDNI